jgi:RNA 2',3'-cyclic 3'-phosphodiesterase
MRLFVAAPLPVTILEALESLQARYNFSGVRLVPTPNLHLTLHFLGETPASMLPAITEKLQAIAATQHAFTLIFKETAPGPKLKSPRLIWARFQEHPEFTQLSRSIQAALNFQSPPHSDFIPHITIARLKKEKVNTKELPVINSPDFPPFRVNSFSIWQSELGSPHPRYSILQDFPLQAADL